MSITEDAMSSDEQTVGQQQPPERPEPATGDETIVDERERRQDALASITISPGDRKTDSVWMLVVEAELVGDGKELDNPAKPTTENVGERFRERLDEHDEDLVPAWTRPWEVDE